MLQGTTGASKRGPSAINVLGDSHSCLFTNCTAGSNPEMFPPQLREPVKHMPDVFPTGFWMHVPRLPKTWWGKKSLPGFGTSNPWFYQGMSMVRNRREAGLAGWSQGQEHPQLDLLLSQLHSLTAAQPALWICHNSVPSCSFTWIHLQPSVFSPLPLSTGANITRDRINSLLIGLQMWVSGELVNWLYMS